MVSLSPLTDGAVFGPGPRTAVTAGVAMGPRKMPHASKFVNTMLHLQSTCEQWVGEPRIDRHLY